LFIRVKISFLNLVGWHRLCLLPEQGSSVSDQLSADALEEPVQQEGGRRSGVAEKTGKNL
jgi:hypothetical protein